MMHGYGMGGFFGFCSLWGIIIAIILIVVWMIKERKNSTNGSSKKKILETLKYRLAKGEITEEEYDRLKQKLEE